MEKPDDYLPFLGSKYTELTSRIGNLTRKRPTFKSSVAVAEATQLEQVE